MWSEKEEGHTSQLMKSIYKLQQDAIQTDTMFICLDGHVMGMQHHYRNRMMHMRQCR